MAGRCSTGKPATDFRNAEIRPFLRDKYLSRRLRKSASLPAEARSSANSFWRESISIVSKQENKRSGDPELLSSCRNSRERQAFASAARALGRAAFDSPVGFFFATTGLASPAIFASRANEAGDETASSDRLLRSRVLPAAFSPAMNWP